MWWKLGQAMQVKARWETAKSVLRCGTASRPLVVVSDRPSGSRKSGLATSRKYVETRWNKACAGESIHKTRIPSRLARMLLIELLLLNFRSW